ncbi:MAG TPA: ATP-dependent zinc metalloprotease FtsH, partial [Alphaproteobacteria bacterium]|nr:ATP-dependent zinc metalloprotease FtsH [Alphaproteobacteria bacterium]
GRVTFDDVAGIEEAREDLEDIVDFLKDPQRYQRLGGNIPKGGLLVGPPGTGKTLIARAVAGEANVPFFTISGSDFVEMFVGVGASRVRDMFEQAKKNSPCIIFIDEIDAVGRKRGSGMGGGNEEREQTLNQLLVEMDGFEKTDSIIILAATNRVDVLDPALLRPGRFDRQIEVPNPDVGGREKILKVHMRKSPISPDVDVKIIARGTSGFSGAELANLVNEAALLAAKRNKRLVTQVEFEDAREKMIMGPEKKSSVVSDKVKKLVAYHEAGHVIPVIHLKDESEPVHKVTIIGRRGAGGYMARMPNENDPMDEIKMKANMVIAAGGRIAEELMLGRRGPGASADIAMVTDMARAMVTQYGFSDKVGFVRHAGGQREVLGQIVGQSAEISQETQRLIDEEVKRLSDEAYAKCREILQSNQDQLINVAEALIEFESLTGAEAEAAALAAPGKGKEAVKTLRDRKPIGSSILSGVYGSVPTTKPNPPAPANDSLG